MLRRLIGEDIQLLWSPGADLWPVKVDPSQMDQVMANLAVNARDAIGGVGTVTIETRNYTFPDRQPRAYVDGVPGDYVLLIVRDSGQGMDEETRAHIFEPFYTTKGPGKGVGLGLATLFGIVKQNKGFIDVQSEPGLGAAFTIGLPRSPLPHIRDASAAMAAPARGRNETLLLVEDEQAILRFGEESLRRLGYQVLVANTPELALDLARQHVGPIHLLITDVVLPTMNGRELAQLLCSITPELKCLFMSGYTADIIADRGVVDEKLNFIQKPFSLEALAAKIRAVLDGPATG
jgi:CheY-like chemotaxis protein